MPTITTVDKYQIIAPLGQGNFGQVFHAFDRALRCEKAIKILEVTDPAQFLEGLKEAQILRRCSHKHIVAINEANIFAVNGNRRVVLDLEYIAEGSLEKALKSRWISTRDAVSYLRGALLGLEHAHGESFLHRDIKPGNILLSSSAAKLSDFGLATQPGPGLPGSARGYVTHLAPEFFMSRSTTAQTDIYAAGVTLFRALSNMSDWDAVIGALPDYRKHVEGGTLISAIGFERYIPDRLKWIVRKACAADPASRFETARIFGQHLDRLRHGIDWIRSDELRWVGSCNDDHYEALVEEKKNHLVLRKNGRRVNNACGSYDSTVKALQALNDHVARTTLK